MKIVTTFFLFLGMIQLAFGLDKEFSNDHFISDLSFNKDKVGIFLGTGAWSTELAYELNRDDFKLSKLTPSKLKAKYPTVELAHRDFLPDPKITKFNIEGKEISYEYKDCKISKDMEDDPFFSVCNELLLKVGNESLNMKSRFYYYEKLVDPVFFEDLLIFKVYLRAGSTDRGDPYPPEVFRIAVFNLKEKAEVKRFTVDSSNVFKGTFISLLKKDTNRKILWVGNKYGLYGLNEKLEEKISCFYIKSDKTFDFKCTEADFVEDKKSHQAYLLNKKMSGEKVVDTTKMINLKFECFGKNRKLFDEFVSDKNPNKWQDKRHETIVNCYKNRK